MCVDNYYTGSKANVTHLLDNTNFELMRHDITFPLYVEVDDIYNLACPAAPIHYQFDPVQTTKTDVHGSDPPWEKWSRSIGRVWLTLNCDEGGRNEPENPAADR